MSYKRREEGLRWGHLPRIADEGRLPGGGNTEQALPKGEQELCKQQTGENITGSGSRYVGTHNFHKDLRGWEQALHFIVEETGTPE